MHNNFQILDPSFIVALAIFAAATAKRGFSGYSSVLGGREFGYKFDRTKLGRCGRTILVIMGICFIYGLIATGSVGGGLGFCVIILPFSALACLLNVCCVPKVAPKKSQKTINKFK